MDDIEVKKTWDHFLKKRDKKSQRKLVEHYFGYVKKIATKLSKKFNNKASMEELASHGLTGLYRTIAHYDKKRCVRFETYSYSRIKGAMIDGMRSEDWVPRSVRLRQSAIENAKHKKENKTKQEKTTSMSSK